MQPKAGILATVFDSAVDTENILTFVATKSTQTRLRLSVFDAFGHHRQSQIVRQPNGGLDNHSILFIGQHMCDERDVNL